MQRIVRISWPVCLFLSIILIIESIPISIAQAEDRIEVMNVDYKISGNKIIVSYDLSGPLDKEYKVALTLRRESQSDFEYEPKEVSGYVGENCKGGKGLEIEWDFIKEFPKGLSGNDYYFKVDAEMVKGRSNMWWWIAGGAAVAGGTAAILSKGSSKTNTPVFPGPPDRP